MTVPQAAITTTINRGGQAANRMSQEQQPSAFDVWSHSYDGMANRMQSAATSPASILDADAGQLANVASAATNMQSSSLSQVAGSMAAQTSALGQSVTAIGEAQGALQTVGATFALLTGVEQMLSSALSFIPFPSFPALRIADFDIGLPHAHSHPPNLIPPAPPVPLPSTGPVIPIPMLSGATHTLINGMPAARCGDMGLGVWCGGYFPMYEVFLGSSNVWVEGARAARLLVDITKHCMFTVPKPNDPPLGPMIGTTISASPNVLIGGIPMPSLTSLAMGAAMKGVFKLAGKGARAFGRLTAPLRRRLASHLDDGFLKCKILRAEPVNFATGEVVVHQRDYELSGRYPVDWTRHYGSHSSRKGVCGYGWSTSADARLVVEPDGAVLFYDGRGSAKIFPYLPAHSTVKEFVDGAALESVNDTLRVCLKDGQVYVFGGHSPASGKVELPVHRVEDRCGSSIRYVRNEAGLSEIVHSTGRRIKVRSKDGLIQEMWLRRAENEAAHLLVRYEYSEAGELLAVYDALERPYTFRYEQRRLVQHTDRNGLSFYYAYDGDRQSARCHHAWGDGGLYNYRFEFDPTAYRVTITDSLGAVSSLQLNELRQPIWEIDPLGGITRYEYDERGRTTGVIDQDGNRTGYEYDENGNLVRLTRPDGKCIETTYSEDNRPVSITEPNGARWERQWDERGLLVQATSPLGHIARYEYDAHGQLATFTNPRGARTELSFNSAGNLASVKNALGHTTRFDYDDRGNLTAKVDPLDRKTRYRYDAKGRLTSIYQPSGAHAHCEYDAEDNLIRYVDENGAETRLEYFGQGEVARRIQPDGQTVQYHYDTEERLVGVTNQRGQTLSLRRDALGRVIEEIDYWGQSLHYRYSGAGYIRETIDALGRKTSYSTDPLGRILKKAFAVANLPQQAFEETYAYEPNGNIIVSENPHTRLERSFDPEGKLVEEKQGEHCVIRNTYDSCGNRTSRQTLVRCGGLTRDQTVRYHYNALDRAIEIDIGQRMPIKLGYDADGQIIAEQLTSNLVRNAEYSADGYLTRRRLRIGGKDLIDTEYSYDPAGCLIRRRDSRWGTDLFEYDPLGRVIQHVSPEGVLSQYLSDPAGDLLRTRVHESPPASGEPGAQGGDWSREGTHDGASYRFDRAGDLVGRRDQRGDLALVWNANHRLVESRLNGVGTAYGYDALGRRVCKQTAGQKTCFFWDGALLIGEITIPVDPQTQAVTEAPRRVREYLYYPGAFEPLARVDANRDGHVEVFYYHNDVNGCPMQLTDGDGQVRWAASYRLWGEVEKLHSQATDNALRLQGQYYDEESGLHYNAYRYYEPQIGQFITQDPLRLVAGENLYQFGNNPFTWIDPLGLKCERIARNPSEAHAAIREQWGHNMTGAEMRELHETINRIRARQPHFPNDDTVFQNSHLISPDAQRLNTGNTYREWRVRTPGGAGAGQRRIVVNEQTGQFFYSHDHYDSYIEIVPGGWR